MNLVVRVRSVLGIHVFKVTDGTTKSQGQENCVSGGARIPKLCDVTPCGFICHCDTASLFQPPNLLPDTHTHLIH